MGLGLVEGWGITVHDDVAEESKNPCLHAPRLGGRDEFEGLLGTCTCFRVTLRQEIGLAQGEQALRAPSCPALLHRLREPWDGVGDMKCPRVSYTDLDNLICKNRSRPSAS